MSEGRIEKGRNQTSLNSAREPASRRKGFPKRGEAIRRDGQGTMGPSAGHVRPASQQTKVYSPDGW